jgi:hypothetical protein
VGRRAAERDGVERFADRADRDRSVRRSLHERCSSASDSTVPRSAPPRWRRPDRIRGTDAATRTRRASRGDRDRVEAIAE